MTLEIVDIQGDDHLAKVFVAKTADGACVEFVESVQPPIPRSEKWVLIVSTLKGCPVGCPICDAGGEYRGRLSAAEIHAQIELLIRGRYPDGIVPVPKLKIQFARMGDPAFNPAVLDVIDQLPSLYRAPGLMPSISTVAPAGCTTFLNRLAEIKNRLYDGGRFQMQFSVHTTDDLQRRQLIPVRTLSLEEIAGAGERFFSSGDRKVTLNFAPAKGYALDPAAIAALFDPEKFAIKLTPINPTFAATASGLEGVIDPEQPEQAAAVADAFKRAGFETILSIGELRENQIGSNCGMFVQRIAASTVRSIQK